MINAAITRGCAKKVSDSKIFRFMIALIIRNLRFYIKLKRFSNILYQFSSPPPFELAATRRETGEFVDPRSFALLKADRAAGGAQ